MALPADYQTGTVTGSFVDTDGDPVAGFIRFTPSAPTLVSAATDTIIVSRPIKVQLEDGEFTVALPATNDAQITPTGFTYKVEEVFRDLPGRSYNIAVPVGSTNDLSDVAVVDADPGSAVARRAGLDLVLDFGADPTGVADSTAAFQAAVDYPSDSTGLVGSQVNIPPGQYRITDTINCYRWAGSLVGFGAGTSPAYTEATRGAGSVIIWDGAADEPMFQIRDSIRPTFRNLRIEGKTLAPPSAAFHYRKETADSYGTNTRLTLDNVHVGVFPWTTRDTDEATGADFGLVDSVLLIDGTNSDNDEIQITNCTFMSRGGHGTAIKCTASTQSVWSSMRGCKLEGWDVGIESASTMAIYSTAFNACGTDLKINSTATLFVWDWQSENSDQLAEMGPNARLVVSGGRLQVTGLTDAEGGIIDAGPSGSGQVIDFSNVEFFGTLPSSATISFGPASPTQSASGGFSIRFARCWGLPKDALALATGSSLSWASTTIGLLEWDMWHSTEGHVQWRNQIRGSGGAGTQTVRTSIDKTVWEGPS
jgi:hypothetical protein